MKVGRRGLEAARQAGEGGEHQKITKLNRQTKRKYTPINHRTKTKAILLTYLYTVNPPRPAHLPPQRRARPPKRHGAPRAAVAVERPGGVVTRARHTPSEEGPTTVRAAGPRGVREGCTLPASVRLISRE